MRPARQTYKISPVKGILKQYEQHNKTSAHNEQLYNSSNRNITQNNQQEKTHNSIRSAFSQRIPKNNDNDTVWKTNKEVRQANIQLAHNVLSSNWLTGRLCVITYRTIHSVTNISHASIHSSKQLVVSTCRILSLNLLEREGCYSNFMFSKLICLSIFFLEEG